MNCVHVQKVKPVGTYPCLWLRGILPSNLSKVPYGKNNIVLNFDYKYDLNMPLRVIGVVEGTLVTVEVVCITPSPL